MRIPVSLLLASAACSTTKPPVTDDFTDLSTLDAKSDSFSSKMKIVGSLDYGQTSASISYTKTPRYRAVKFSGHQGDAIDVWVRSTNGGDSVAWVLDNKFNVLGYNDDAGDTTFDSHVELTLRASTSDTHYIVFRDYWGSAAKFKVELSGPPTYDTSCQHDSDCVAVSLGGCCPDGTLFAVNASSTDAYAAATACTAPPQLCPQHMVLDARVAECNAPLGTCEMVAIENIACGAHSTNSHSCPDGFACNAPGTDAPGHCIAQP